MIVELLAAMEAIVVVSLLPWVLRLSKMTAVSMDHYSVKQRSLQNELLTVKDVVEQHIL